MIENEIAKLENPDQRSVQLLLVTEFGEPLLVVAHLAGQPCVFLQCEGACSVLRGTD